MYRAAMVALAALLASCSATPVPPATPAAPEPEPEPVVANRAAPPCTPGFVGHLISESAQVAIDGERIYWHEYNFGTIESRPRGDGAITTVLPARDQEHHSEDMLLAGEYLYWSSKADAALFRVGRSGGEPELLLNPNEFPLELAHAHGTLYATTFGAYLAWVRPGDGGTQASGTTALPPEAISATLAAAGDTLLVGTNGGLFKATSSGAPLEPVYQTPNAVTAIAATDATLWWLEEESLGNYRTRRLLASRPRAGGEATRRPLPDTILAALAPGPGGLYLSLGNVLYFVADGAGELIPVAIAPANVTGLAAHDDTVIAGTAAGSVHRVCPDPTRPAELAAPADRTPPACPAGLVLSEDAHRAACVDAEGRATGPSRTWYASGHLESDRRTEDGREVSEEFYADGQLRWRQVGTWDHPVEDAYYYANGQPAFKTVTGPDGTPVTERYDLDGNKRP